MRFVKPLGKAAKFTAVTMPLSIFGWQLNKRLFAWVRALWAGSINPRAQTATAASCWPRRRPRPSWISR